MTVCATLRGGVGSRTGAGADGVANFAAPSAKPPATPVATDAFRASSNFFSLLRDLVCAWGAGAILERDGCAVSERLSASAERRSLFVASRDRGGSGGAAEGSAFAISVGLISSPDGAFSNRF